MKIHNLCKIHEYNICGCQVISFQNFSYRFSIHEMVLFGGFLGPNSPKYCPILMNISPEVLFKEKKNGIFKNLRKIQIFTETGDTQSLLFWSDADTLFHPEDGKNKKNNCFVRKALTIGLSKYREIRVLYPLAFPGKIRLLFPYFGYFWQKTGQNQRVRIKI